MDLERIRADFPILERQINGKRLVYLDNAATTQKPSQVLQTLQTFYTRYNANIHRSPHTLGQEATELYEQAHENVARFIGAEGMEEVIFLRNTTEAVNLVAQTLPYTDPPFGLAAGDEIVLTVMEHHSDIVPWQMLRQRHGIRLKFADVRPDGRLDLDSLKSLIGDRTKLVACAHVSNVLGVINPVAEIGRLAHQVGALFLIDAAQSVPHMPVDVEEIGCDLMSFSGHKMLAPLGVGVLYGRRDLLEAMSPFLFGGDMIREVTLEESTWNRLPWKFEAGTSNFAGGIALGGAVDWMSGEQLEGAVTYLKRLGMEAVLAHERELTAYALAALSDLEGVRLYGPSDVKSRLGVVSFNLVQEGVLVDSHLVAQLLNEYGIAVRSGGHCAHPLTACLGLPGTVRASFYIYNTQAEVDLLIEALAEIAQRRLI